MRLPSNDVVYYAQSGEDVWLKKNWRRLGLPKKGIFVEVGVANGTAMSNTLWLEKRGWDGLLIEPDPRFHEIIRATRRATLVPCAVGRKRARFCLTSDAMLSGFLRKEGKMIKVTTKGLTEVLDEHHLAAVDVLSIDTEGTEIEVWKTFDSARFRPRVVIAEWSTIGLPSNYDALLDAICESGYEADCVLGANIMFVRADLVS